MDMRAAKAVAFALSKTAAQITSHGAVSTALADTVGRAVTPLNVTPLLVAGFNSLRSSRRNRDEHQDAVDTMSSARPDALSNTAVRLGGPDIIDDAIWKYEQNGETLPWYKQIGGRILQNPRTGPLGKLIGYPTAPIRYLLSSLMRAPNYDPYTDVVHNMWKSRGITEHELGHAIDFNSLTNKGKVPKTMLGRAGAGTVRDLYGLSYSIPGVNLWHEARANQQSEHALRDGIQNKEKYLNRIKDRYPLLSSAYGTYVGNALGTPLGPAGTLIGPIIGAIAGRAYGSGMQDDESEIARYAQKWDKSHATDGRDNKDKADKKDERTEKAAKQANAGYALDNLLHMQQYSPQMNRRELVPEEQAAVDAGKSRWLPKIFQSYATPASELMSSPTKGGWAAGLGTAGAGALLGALAGAFSQQRGGQASPITPFGGAAMGAGVGAAAGLPVGLLTYFNRRQNNENIEELMRRLPQGATKRDVLADPVYQKDLDRRRQQELQQDMLWAQMQRGN